LGLLRLTHIGCLNVKMKRGNTSQKEKRIKEKRKKRKEEK